MYPLKYDINLYFVKRNAMEFIEMYKATELAERLGVHRKKIPLERWLYIPIRVKTAITKNNKQGYGVRYIYIKDVKNYLRTKCNKNPDVKHRTRDYKRKDKNTN